MRIERRARVGLGQGEEIRASAIKMNVPLLTTLTAAMAAVAGIRALKERDLSYTSLQDHYAKQKN